MQNKNLGGNAAKGSNPNKKQADDKLKPIGKESNRTKSAKGKPQMEDYESEMQKLDIQPKTLKDWVTAEMVATAFATFEKTLALHPTTQSQNAGLFSSLNGFYNDTLSASFLYSEVDETAKCFNKDDFCGCTTIGNRKFWHKSIVIETAMDVAKAFLSWERVQDAKRVEQKRIKRIADREENIKRIANEYNISYEIALALANAGKLKF